MNRTISILTAMLVAGVSVGCSSDDDDDTEQSVGPLTAADGISFFVTSRTNPTGDLGGLEGADDICTELATAVGADDKTWHAYLSSDTEDARDRIGTGPWFNAELALIANDLASLHALPSGDAEVMIDENGTKINGQWAGSPAPNQHDILTGSAADGTKAPNDAMGRDATCNNWTSAATDAFAQVGHADGLGPMMNPAAPFNSWNSSHANQDCSNTAPRGGSGRFYCFASR
jgi:hypothetical protein